MDQTITKHIESNPSVCGGKPCISGSRIRVQDVYVWHELQGLSVDEIASRFPQLTMADIYAALAYYWDNRDELQRQMREENALVDSLKRKYPSPLKEKLAGRNAANNPIPS